MTFPAIPQALKHWTPGILGACAATLLGAAPAHAASVVGPGDVSGKIGDITSTRAGLLIRMDDDARPANCASSPVAWMHIAAADQAMISTFLTYWAAGKRDFAIYTDAWTGSGYCAVSQIDPYE